MFADKKCLIMGLGVPDPKGIFGSTLNLQKNLEKKGYLIFRCPKMLLLEWQ